MTLRGRSRWNRQVATNVSATETTNRVQESDKMSSNAHEIVRKNVEESIFDCFDKKLYKRFSIEMKCLVMHMIQ